MSAWVSLLLLAACLRCGCAEGDPLPPALVELVRSSPIASIQDLQLLLLSDSVEEESDSQHSNTSNRIPRSLDAEPAQQAMCKVRTEVMEVTRAMLDRSNANFLLWPPCVEVQRCSGCCNTKTLQCVPILTHTRYLQVMKIEYVNKRPLYEKAVVSVYDHVECQCQPTPRKKSISRQPIRERGGAAKHRPKGELQHRQQLKHHQLEALLSQGWTPLQHTSTTKYSNATIPKHSNTSATQLLYTRENNTNTTQHFAPDAAPPLPSLYNLTAMDSTRERGEERAGERKNERVSGEEREGRKRGSFAWHGQDREKASENNTSWYALANQAPETAHRPKEANQGEKQELSPKESANQSDGHTPWANQSFVSGHNHIEGGSHGQETNQKQEEVRPTQQTNQKLSNNETPGSGRSSKTQLEHQVLEEEKQALLLLHKRLDEEKRLLKEQQQQQQQEEDEHSRHTKTTKTTTQQTKTMPLLPARAPPPRPAPRPRPRPRPNPSRRQQRKQRYRLSKAAMRAMLM